MIRDVILPQLAMGMSEGAIVAWDATEGAFVKRDQTLVSIETEKVVTDLPAPFAGFVHFLAKPGDKFPVESVIAKIADTEDEYRSLLSGGDSPRAVKATPIHNSPTGDAEPIVSSQSQARLMEALPSLANPPPQSAPIVGKTSKIRASGLAKAIARTNGIDLAQLEGSGPGGRIVRRDVELAVNRLGTPTTRQATGPGAMRERARVPLTGVRAAIAQKMLAAKTTAAQTYAFFEIDITKLVAARKTILGFQEELATRVSMISFYTRAMALACQHVPICNATLANGEIIVWENINIGIAVALPGRTEYESNLLVPVIRDVQQKGVLQIDKELKDLVKRARTSELSPSDMAGGTITISSTDGFLPGSWVVSTPMLNLPQVVNFQPGAPIDKPVVVDGQIVIRTMLPCGITYDHRALDGEPLGRLLTKLRDLLSNPELMLL